jgi:hypothetical protein
MINYEGIFFEGKDLETILLLEKTKLDIINDVIHCTFRYKPTDVEASNEIVGQYFDVTLVGYACDDKNSGFIVLLDEKVAKYYKNENSDSKIVPPHITCSISENSKASATANLTFALLEKPTKVKGRYGYYIKNEDGKAYVSYEPFKIIK